jgi:hypothetical protein
MTGDLRQVPVGALTVSVQLTAELAHNFTNSCWVKVHVVFHVPKRLRETTGPTFQSSKTSGGLTTSWDDPKRLERLFLQLFIHTLTRGHGIRWIFVLLIGLLNLS